MIFMCMVQKSASWVFTFKENCLDVRNTKVVDIINELESYCIEPVVYDPVADSDNACKHYGVKLKQLNDIRCCKVIIIAVAHDAFKNETILGVIDDCKVVVDVKNISSTMQIHNSTLTLEEA